MSQPYTYSGAKFYISNTAANSDLTGVSPGFDSLQYTEISNVGNIGAYGLNTNMISYPVMARPMALKAKGNTDGGTFTLQCADDVSDSGQQKLAAAGDPSNGNNYVLKVEFTNGVVHYIRGPIGGPSHPGGNNEAFVVNEYTVGVNELFEDYGSAAPALSS